MSWPLLHTEPEMTVSLPSGSQLVYAVPLAYRNVAKMPTLRSTVPRNEPWRQSRGNERLAAAEMLCGRLAAVGAIACGGAWLPPEIWLMTREPKLMYVNGSEPVFLAC